MRNATIRELRYPCQECGQMVGPGPEYHPYLYCVLWKAGIRDQQAFLRVSGWMPNPLETPAFARAVLNISAPSDPTSEEQA